MTDTNMWDDLQTVRITEPAPGVLTLAIDRPEVLNAFDDATMLEMLDAIGRVARSSARVLVVVGSERAFSTGSDLEEALSASLPEHLEHWRLGHAIFDALEALEIAAIRGWALAGGCELALACDLRIAGEGAMMGLPEIKIGVIPSCGGTQRLPRVVGRARALELLCTGDAIPAAEALRIGLVNHVVPDDQVLEAALELAGRIAANPRLAVAAAKALAQASETVELVTGAQLEALRNSACVMAPDFRERVGAFIARRDKTPQAQ
jgi:enoyl-CoA hydratase/carnithine racemase